MTTEIRACFTDVSPVLMMMMMMVVMMTQTSACFTDVSPVLMMMVMMMIMQVSAWFTDVCLERAVLLRQTVVVLPVAVIGGAMTIKTLHLSAVKTVKIT